MKLQKTRETLQKFSLLIISLAGLGITTVACNFIGHREVSVDPKQKAIDDAGQQHSQDGAQSLGDPKLLSITPSSPSYSSLTPLLVGTCDANTKFIVLYSNNQCSGTPLGSGTKDAFEQSGIQVPVGADSTTTIYARAVGTSLSLRSNCVLLTAFQTITYNANSEFVHELSGAGSTPSGSATLSLDSYAPVADPLPGAHYQLHQGFLSVTHEAQP